jgi:hypothetical protein
MDGFRVEAIPLVILAVVREPCGNPCTGKGYLFVLFFIFKLVETVQSNVGQVSRRKDLVGRPASDEENRGVDQERPTSQPLGRLHEKSICRFWVLAGVVAYCLLPAVLDIVRTRQHKDGHDSVSVFCRLMFEVADKGLRENKKNDRG